MVDKRKLAAVLGSRQKRIVNWRHDLQAQHWAPEFQAKFREKLETYALLLSKLSKSINEGQLAETLERVEAAEQELTNMADSSRFETYFPKAS